MTFPAPIRSPHVRPSAGEARRDAVNVPEAPARSPSPPPDGDGRPTAVRAVFAPCVAPTWTAGLVLFLCLWLPQFTGCDGIDVRPIDRIARADGFEQQLEAVAVLWPHWFGLLTAVALVAVAVVRPADPGRYLVIAPLTVWVALLFVTGAQLALHPPPSKQDWLEVLLWLPIVLAPGVWAGFALCRRQWLAAWARLTSTLAVLVYPMLVLSTLPSRSSLYGMTVALVAAACLAPLAWILRWRGRRALVDRRASTEPIRFRLGQLVLFTTLVAATLGYYRLMPWLVDEAKQETVQRESG